jgi:hypothetical protein
MEDIVAQWPFVVAALIFSGFSQVLKGTLYSAAAIKRYSGTRTGEILWWGRKTLPLQPVLVGFVFGLVPGMPVAPEIAATTAARVLYFCGAGICSTWVFSVLKGVAKSRGIDLDDLLIAETMPPPEAIQATPAAAVPASHLKPLSPTDDESLDD